MPDHSTLGGLRRLLLLLYLLSTVGAAAELLLVEHTEDFWQLVPLILLAASLPLVVWIQLRPGSRSPVRRLAVRGFQTLMLINLASAAVGLYLHYRANAEFELEMYPDLAGWPLFWKAIQGASPPSLAPATMAVIGLIGLAWTYRHPAILHPADSTPHSKEALS